LEQLTILEQLLIQLLNQVLIQLLIQLLIQVLIYVLIQLLIYVLIQVLNLILDFLWIFYSGLECLNFLSGHLISWILNSLIHHQYQLIFLDLWLQI